MEIKALEYNINYEIKEFIEDYNGGGNVLELCLYKLGVRDFDEDKLDEILSSLNLLSCVEDYEVTLDQQLVIFIDQDYLDFKLNNRVKEWERERQLLDHEYIMSRGVL
jgi:hypothetical protein